MPTHLLSEGEVEKFVGVPVSHKCCNHMETVLTSREDLKPSKASGFVQVWLSRFRTSRGGAPYGLE